MAEEVSNLPRRRMRLGEMLVAAGVIVRQDLSAALKVQREAGGRLGQILLARGALSEEALARALAAQADLAIGDLDRAKVPERLLKHFPREFVEKHGVFPMAVVAEDDGPPTMFLGVVDPTNQRVIDKMSMALGGMKVTPLVVTESSLARAVSRHFRAGPSPAASEAPAPPPAAAASPGSGSKDSPSSSGPRRIDELMAKLEAKAAEADEPSGPLKPPPPQDPFGRHVAPSAPAPATSGPIKNPFATDPLLDAEPVPLVISPQELGQLDDDDDNDNDAQGAAELSQIPAAAREDSRPVSRSPFLGAMLDDDPIVETPVDQSLVVDVDQLMTLAPSPHRTPVARQPPTFDQLFGGASTGAGQNAMVGFAEMFSPEGMGSPVKMGDIDLSAVLMDPNPEEDSIDVDILAAPDLDEEEDLPLVAGAMLVEDDASVDIDVAEPARDAETLGAPQLVHEGEPEPEPLQLADRAPVSRAPAPSSAPSEPVETTVVRPTAISEEGPSEEEIRPALQVQPAAPGKRARRSSQTPAGGSPLIARSGPPVALPSGSAPKDQGLTIFEEESGEYDTGNPTSPKPRPIPKGVPTTPADDMMRRLERLMKGVRRRKSK